MGVAAPAVGLRLAAERRAAVSAAVVPQETGAVTIEVGVVAARVVAPTRAAVAMLVERAGAGGATTVIPVTPEGHATVHVVDRGGPADADVPVAVVGRGAGATSSHRSGARTPLR